MMNGAGLGLGGVGGLHGGLSGLNGQVNMDGGMMGGLGGPNKSLKKKKKPSPPDIPPRGNDDHHANGNLTLPAKTKARQNQGSRKMKGGAAMEIGQSHTLGRGSSVLSPNSPAAVGAKSPNAYPMSSMASASMSHSNMLNSEAAAAPVSMSMHHQQPTSMASGMHRGQQHLMDREMMQGTSPPHVPMNAMMHAGDALSAFQSNHQEPGARAAVPPPMPPRNGNLQQQPSLQPPAMPPSPRKTANYIHMPLSPSHLQAMQMQQLQRQQHAANAAALAAVQQAQQQQQQQQQQPLVNFTGQIPRSFDFANLNGASNNSNGNSPPHGHTMGGSEAFMNPTLPPGMQMPSIPQPGHGNGNSSSMKPKLPPKTSTSDGSTTLAANQGYTHGSSGIPTPPSHHSHVSGGGLGGAGVDDQSPASAVMSNGGAPSLDHYLTPSPDSPGQWSSTTSPHSVATSDWSDGIHSPPQHLQHQLHMPQQNALPVR